VAASSQLRGQVAALANSALPRATRAERIAEVLRQAGGYRWVGIYDVLEKEIAAIGWTGPSASAYPRFSRDRGLCGAAAAKAETVIANDVSLDLTSAPGRVKYRIAKGIAFHSVTMARGPTNS
jgi:putative methionine-R-sulfoxide reductase with GAF domain